MAAWPTLPVSGMRKSVWCGSRLAPVGPEGLSLTTSSVSPRAIAILLATALLSGETLADDITFVADTITSDADGACFVFSIDIDGDGRLDRNDFMPAMLVWRAMAKTLSTLGLMVTIAAIYSVAGVALVAAKHAAAQPVGSSTPKVERGAAHLGGGTLLPRAPRGRHG